MGASGGVLCRMWIMGDELERYFWRREWIVLREGVMLLSFREPWEYSFWASMMIRTEDEVETLEAGTPMISRKDRMAISAGT